MSATATTTAPVGCIVEMGAEKTTSSCDDCGAVGCRCVELKGKCDCMEKASKTTSTPSGTSTTATTEGSQKMTTSAGGEGHVCPCGKECRCGPSCTCEST